MPSSFSSSSSLLLIVVLIFTILIIITSPGEVSAAVKNDGPSSLFKNSQEIEEITSFCQITSIIRDRYRATVIFFYDSGDLNSWRMKNVLEESASLLSGFAHVVAADIRNPNVTMLRAAWSVNTVPWAYGLGPKHFKPRTEEFGSSASSSLSLLTGIRTPIPRLPHFGEMNPQTIRKFGLGLVADSSLVIQHIEGQSQLTTLEKEISSSSSNNNNKKCNVVLLTDKSQSSLLYRALAANYAQRCSFYEVNVKKLPSALKTFDAAKTPHLMAFIHHQKETTGEVEKSVYEGQLNINEIDKNFLTPLCSETREEMQKRLYNEHKSALIRETKRHESPLMEIETIDDWNSEVDQRAGVVGLIFIPSSSSSEEESTSLLEKARKAVQELRDKEEKKKMRSNVVQFLAISRRDDVDVAKVEDVLASSGNSLSQEDKASKIGVYFISSRKKVATRFLGALSGDGLFGFMRNELKNGIGVKNIDMDELKNSMMMKQQQ